MMLQRDRYSRTITCSSCMETFHHGTLTANLQHYTVVSLELAQQEPDLLFTQLTCFETLPCAQGLLESPAHQSLHRPTQSCSKKALTTKTVQRQQSERSQRPWCKSHHYYLPLIRSTVVVAELDRE